MFSFIIVIVAEMTLVSTKPSKCYIRYRIFHLIPHTPAMDSSRLFNDDPMSLLTSAFTNQHALFTKTFRMVVHSIRSHITHTSQLLCRYVWVLQYQTQNLFRSLFRSLSRSLSRSHHILRLPNGRIHHKLILPVLRCCSILHPLQAHYSSPRRDRPPLTHLLSDYRTTIESLDEPQAVIIQRLTLSVGQNRTII